MSMWFNARSRAALASLALVIAPACSPPGAEEEGRRVRTQTITEAETRVDTVPQEEPGVARRLWNAENELARTVAGNLSASLEEGRGGPLALAFANGITLRAEQLAAYESGARIGADAETFQTLLDLPTQVDARIYRVAEETISRSAAQGGLCGASRTTTLAIAEFVDGDDGWVLRVASFRGADAPGEGRGDPQLCGAFAYEQP